MYALIAVIKYTFVAALAVEVVLILRSLFNLAREKAKAATPVQPAEE